MQLGHAPALDLRTGALKGRNVGFWRDMGRGQGALGGICGPQCSGFLDQGIRPGLCSAQRATAPRLRIALELRRREWTSPDFLDP
jgi:hypothetical protein